MQLFRFGFVILILMLAGCESYVKYPSQSAVYHFSSSTVSARNKPKTKLKSVRHNKRGRILKSGRVIGDICFSYRLIQYRRFERARRILVRLEEKHLSNVDYSRVYALLGMIDAFENRSSKDYFEIAYAYDPKNRMAKYMLTSRKPSLRFALQFGQRWCIHVRRR